MRVTQDHIAFWREALGPLWRGGLEEECGVRAVGGAAHGWQGGQRKGPKGHKEYCMNLGEERQWPWRAQEQPGQSRHGPAVDSLAGLGAAGPPVCAPCWTSGLGPMVAMPG